MSGASFPCVFLQVCLFGDATQKEGHSKVSLGKWMGGLHMSELVFEGGQSCWQGPKRSMRVKLQCGSAEQLHSVEEPSRCEYAAVLSTPAACSTADLDASNVRIGELKAMLKEVRGSRSRTFGRRGRGGADFPVPQSGGRR